MAGPESPIEAPVQAEPIPNYIIEPDVPPHVTVPSYAKYRKGYTDDARSFQHDDAALIAAGKIPKLNLSAQGKPDSTTTETLRDGRKVALKFDAQSHLSSVEITSRNGDSDVATISNGRVERETVKAKGATVSYTFDEQNHVKQQTILQDGIVETLDFVDNKLVHGRQVQAAAGIVSDLTNQPDDHTYRVDQGNGIHLNFQYDEKGKFVFGTEHDTPTPGNDNDRTWLISPDGKGGTKVVRGQEV